MADSSKNSGSCIAGIEITPTGFADWIRPVSNRPTEELRMMECLYSDNTSPRLLDVIDIPLLRPAPTDHQQENHLIDSSSAWKKVSVFPFHLLPQLTENPATLWQNGDNGWAGTNDRVKTELARAYKRSLYLVSPERFTIEVNINRYKGIRMYTGHFTLGGHPYSLPVTDFKVDARLRNAPIGPAALTAQLKTYLCISLGRHFGKDDCCHKLIAAVITDPPL